MSMVYHEGELAVQREAHQEESARLTIKGIRDFIPKVAAQFLEQQVMVLVGFVDREGKVRACVLWGEAGFVKGIDERTVSIQCDHTYAPEVLQLKEGSQVGLLAIDFATRRRMRVNGTVVSIHADTLLVQTMEVYANCPKYIQARTFLGFREQRQPTTSPQRFSSLNVRHIEQLKRADTFFIASVHPNRGADVSHRGGIPGFVHVLDEQTIEVADYAGNAMFNTLGNIYAYSRAGLLFLDFDTGETLQLHGEGKIQWRGTERSLVFTVEQVVYSADGFPLRWEFGNYSPFYPKE
ncbi:pyridoxamine 5'-phosphate oxidase family protein [Paenibacillus sp. YYML68]|uniref:pyridoxamine 5'-phosphate oxidase family protein n=1 Tax=Paenibacillus sp. YYML68 TaxID=2909250 RepID=UPI002490B6BF|nr:pyridoxamine 5'-phosphate oxidase family protein [Paenibacillus sp. YYML68]